MQRDCRPRRLFRRAHTSGKKRHININLLAGDRPVGGGGGVSPGRVSRGQRFMCDLRKTGDRGDQTKLHVLKSYAPFCLLMLSLSLSLSLSQKHASDPDRPTYRATICTKIWTKYDPKCFKTRQTRQFRSHIFVHIFALFVGVGVSKCFPTLPPLEVCSQTIVAPMRVIGVNM